MKDKFSNAKKFVRDHKVGFATTTGIVIGATSVIGCIMYINRTNHELLLDAILDNHGVWDKIEEGTRHFEEFGYLPGAIPSEI
jgi:hypothetical protein